MIYTLIGLLQENISVAACGSVEACQAGLNPSMSHFPLQGTWTGEASIHQIPLPIPPSLLLGQSFYFTPPSAFTLRGDKVESVNRPPSIPFVVCIS